MKPRSGGFKYIIAVSHGQITLNPEYQEGIRGAALKFSLLCKNLKFAATNVLFMKKVTIS